MYLRDSLNPRSEDIRPTFAVVRMLGAVPLTDPREMETTLRGVDGIRNVMVDESRRTVHLLYDGRRETLNQVTELVTQKGADVWTRIRRAPLPRRKVAHSIGA